MRRITLDAWSNNGLACVVLVGLALPANEPQQGDEAVRQRAYDLGVQQVAESRKQNADLLTRDELNAARPAAHARLERIQTEALEPDVPAWAGGYYFGDQRNTNVSIWVAPRSGAYYSWHGCTGLRDINQGEVIGVRPDRVVLDLEIDPNRNKSLNDGALPWAVLSGEWFFVTWGDRDYLVPSSSMIPFCNAVNSGSPLPLSMFPVKWEGPDSGQPFPDFDDVPDGSPKVPEEYAPFLLGEPLSGRIVSASEPRDDGQYDVGYSRLVVEANVDIGLQDGLLPGMYLFVASEKGPGTGLAVAVEESACTAEFRFPVGREPKDYAQAGWPVSTRSFKQPR